MKEKNNNITSKSQSIADVASLIRHRFTAYTHFMGFYNHQPTKRSIIDITSLRQKTLSLSHVSPSFFCHEFVCSRDRVNLSAGCFESWGWISNDVGCVLMEFQSAMSEARLSLSRYIIQISRCRSFAQLYTQYDSQWWWVIRAGNVNTRLRVWTLGLTFIYVIFNFQLCKNSRM